MTRTLSSTLFSRRYWNSLHPLACIVLMCCATHLCLGDEVYRYAWGADGARELTRAEGGQLEPRTAFHAYDNWRGPSFGGVSRLRGTFQCGNDEIADDLTLVTQGPALVRDIAFSVFNTSATNVLSTYRVTHRFYNLDHQLIGSDTWTIFDAPIQPGSGTTFYSDGGFYAPFGIVIPSQVIMSIQLTDIVGIDPEDVATGLAGPRTTGYSSQFAYNLTRGVTLNFDGTDQTNLKFFINTEDVPAPGILIGLTAAVATACRRRR